MAKTAEEKVAALESGVTFKNEEGIRGVKLTVQWDAAHGWRWHKFLLAGAGEVGNV